MAAFARPHVSALASGVGATLGVVLFRLAMPWPLRGIVEIVFPSGAGDASHFVGLLPGRGDPALWLAGFFVILAFGVGLSELVQRTSLKRFAAHLVHDLRAAAVAGAGRRSQTARGPSGDLIARIIGDSARIKAAVSGILVHLVQDAMIFVGVCAVLLVVCPQLGLIYMAAGVVAVVIGLRTSAAVGEVTDKLRRKEGDYAVAVQEGLDRGADAGQLDVINASSARKEVRTTRLIARSAWLTQVVLAVAVGLALWLGTVQVEQGLITPGALFIFIAYSLTLHRRLVQVGRQFARTGKVVACVNRLGPLVGPPEQAAPGAATSPPPPLEQALQLRGVARTIGRGARRRRPLRRLDLTIPAGTRTAVLGPVGAGKSTLLRLLAGIDEPHRGVIAWDSDELAGREGALARRVEYLPQHPLVPPARVWQILGLEGPEGLSDARQRILHGVGAWKVIKRLGRGLEEKVSPTALSPGESRLLRLAGILLSGEESVWILDDPTGGLGRRSAQRTMDQILKSAEGRTLVVALAQSTRLERFDRVLHFRRGKLQFDGPPAAWRARKTNDKKLKGPAAA